MRLVALPPASVPTDVAAATAAIDIAVLNGLEISSAYGAVSLPTDVACPLAVLTNRAELSQVRVGFHGLESNGRTKLTQQQRNVPLAEKVQ